MRQLSFVDVVPPRPGERCRIYAPPFMGSVDGLAMSDHVTLMELHWIGARFGNKGRNVPHFKIGCPYCPSRIIVKGYLYAKIDKQKCFGLMELSSEAARDLGEVLGKRGENLRGLKVTTFRPKGGANGRVVVVLGHRVFEASTVDPAYPVRDVVKILSAKLCGVPDLLDLPSERNGGF